MELEFECPLFYYFTSRSVNVDIRFMVPSITSVEINLRNDWNVTVYEIGLLCFEENCIINFHHTRNLHDNFLQSTHTTRLKYNSGSLFDSLSTVGQCSNCKAVGFRKTSKCCQHHTLSFKSLSAVFQNQLSPFLLWPTPWICIWNVKQPVAWNMKIKRVKCDYWKDPWKISSRSGFGEHAKVHGKRMEGAQCITLSGNLNKENFSKHFENSVT